MTRGVARSLGLLALGLAWLALPGSGLAQDGAADHAVLAEAYDRYYRELAGFPPTALLAELSDTVEDALIAGSHVRTTSLRPTVRRFEDAAHRALRARLCGAGRQTAAGVPLRAAATASVLEAGRDVNARFLPAHAGRLAALFARLVEGVGGSQLCATDDVRRLAR